MSTFCFTTRLPCYPEIHPTQVILTSADGNQVPTTLGTNRTNSFRRGAASYWKFIFMDATSWEWGPLTVGMVASGTSFSHLVYRASHCGEVLEEAPAACVPLLPILASRRTIHYGRGGEMPACPAPSLKLPSENFLSSSGSLLGAGVC